jgi:hypothetical protein
MFIHINRLGDTFVVTATCEDDTGAEACTTTLRFTPPDASYIANQLKTLIYDYHVEQDQDKHEVAALNEEYAEELAHEQWAFSNEPF